MKTNQNNQSEAEKLAKYMSGEMSGDELTNFESEIAVSEENKISIEKMKNQWLALKGYNAPNAPDALNAWNKLHTRLSEQKLIPEQIAGTKNRFNPSFLKIAAVILILIAVSIVIYFQVNPRHSVEMVELNTVNESNTLIKTLNDGSVIYIAHNSRFSFPKEFESDSRNVALQGEAFFDIASNPEKPFIIETDEATIEVLGTAFNVKTNNGKGFELFVDRGKVKVTLKNDPTHSELVLAGEKISSAQNKLVKTRFTSKSDYIWYKQRMHFKDESLQNIISVLNRNFNTTFVLAEKETGSRKLTVTFDNETPETMTELICVTLNLKSQNINGSVILSENKENAKAN